jgi:hypothetical protein
LYIGQNVVLTHMSPLMTHGYSSSDMAHYTVV